MIDLDKLQGMWEKDSKIDNDNLHTESLNIPSLHAKYFELYNTIFLMRKKQNNKERILDMNAMNTLVEKQTQMFMSKIRFLKKLEIRKLCKSILTQMRNSQEFR